MIVLACGFNGAGKFVKDPSDSTNSSDSFLLPKSPYWNHSLEKYCPETTDVQITWNCVYILDTNTRKNRDKDGFKIFGHDLCGDAFQSSKVLCSAAAGISTCFIVEKSLDAGICEISLVSSTGDQLYWYRLPDGMQRVRKIARSIITGSLNSPLILFGIDQCNKLIKMTPDNESERCTCSFPKPDLHFSDISAGREHILFLTTDGKIYSSGLSSRGQLGHGNLDPLDDPKCIEAFEGMRIKHITAGGWSSMALNEFGLVFVWGWNSAGALGFPNRGVREQPGYPTTFEEDVETVELLAEPRHLPLPEEISWISCGERHAGAISVMGKIFVWGLNQHGQLGLGDHLNRDSPVLLELPKSPHLSRIFCGEWATIFLFDNDDLSPNTLPDESEAINPV